MAKVAFRQVAKTYGAHSAIHGVDIDIADGEFVVLVGPSGCGKSTLLRMVAGLEPISGGEISIGDIVVNDLAPKERDIAMVFQSYALYPHMTVEENLGFSLKLARLAADKARPRVLEAARILGLEPYLDRYPRQLSGGQRQRVAMGRAIVRQPAAFLFDEPLSNLDAKLRVSMRTEIKSLHQRLGSTILYVTHDQIEAMTLADRIVVLRDGRVEQIGTPIDLYQNPATQFVATFIGSPGMNILPGVLEAGGVRLGDGQVLPLPQVGAAVQGRPVNVGIRPEHVQPGEAGIEAEIKTVEPTGAQTYLHFDICKEPFSAIVDGISGLRPRQPVRLQVQPGAVRLFDPDSGRRITPEA